MPKRLQMVAAILFVLLGAALIVVIQKASGLSPQPAKEMTYAEFTSVILSALGVMLTALTLFLGAVALIGWTSFEGLVERNTSEYLEKRFGTKDTPTIDANAIRETVRQELALTTPSGSQEPENESPFDEEQM